MLLRHAPNLLQQATTKLGKEQAMLKKVDLVSASARFVVVFCWLLVFAFLCFPFACQSDACYPHECTHCVKHVCNYTKFANHQVEMFPLCSSTGISTLAALTLATSPQHEKKEKFQLLAITARLTSESELLLLLHAITTPLLRALPTLPLIRHN